MNRQMGRVDIERNAKPLDFVKWKCEYLVDAEDQEGRCFVLKEDADSHILILPWVCWSPKI